MTDFQLDMTMMYATHDAFRRDLGHVARMTTRSTGWDNFEHFLRIHHEVEDDALWPVLRKELDGQLDELALVDRMEAEHAVLEPLLAAINDALERGDSAPGSQADLSDRLEEHLRHEEDAALPLIDRTLDEEQWMQFGAEAAARVGANMPTFLPWTLDGQDPERTDAVLEVLPEMVQQSYRTEWQPAYAATDWWSA